MQKSPHNKKKFSRAPCGIIPLPELAHSAIPPCLTDCLGFPITPQTRSILVPPHFHTLFFPKEKQTIAIAGSSLKGILHHSEKLWHVHPRVAWVQLLKASITQLIMPSNLSPDLMASDIYFRKL